MIKTWSIFNENNDNIKDVLSKKLSEVRELFYQFEDLDIVKYSILVSGYERGGYGQFNPKEGDFERFLDYITPIVKLSIKKDDELGGPGLTNKYKTIGRKSSYKISDERLLILIDIKLPGESNEFGSTVIGTDGIELFDDIISGISRLKDLGYNVKLDFNASHGEYKPLKILAYFNI